MSKGIGKVEQAILDATYTAPDDIHRVLGKVREQLGLSDGPSSRVMLSRAIRSLRRKRLIYAEPHYGHVKYIKKPKVKPTITVESELDKAVSSVNTALANIAEIRVHNNGLTKPLVSRYALDLYTWRDAVNELIKILES